jgi:hypothetical protein
MVGNGVAKCGNHFPLASVACYLQETHLASGDGAKDLQRKYADLEKGRIKKEPQTARQTFACSELG